MKGYLIALGAALVVIGVIAGSLYLSNSYDNYQSRLHALGAPAGAPVTVLDTAKWQLSEVLGGGIIVGGLIFGSLLMGLGWIGSTLEQLRDALAREPAENSEAAAPLRQNLHAHGMKV